jgi:hypothetical protein
MLDLFSYVLGCESNVKILMSNLQAFSECMGHEFSGLLGMIITKNSRQERISLSDSSHFAIKPNVGALPSNLFDCRSNKTVPGFLNSTLHLAMKWYAAASESKRLADA